MLYLEVAVQDRVFVVVRVLIAWGMSHGVGFVLEDSSCVGKERLRLIWDCRHSMKEFKTPKLTIAEKNQLLLADGDEEVIFNKLFTAYRGLIVHIARKKEDPTGFVDLGERIHAGQIGLLKVKRKYRQRDEPNPDAAVGFYALREIQRTITQGRRQIPDEEIGITSLDELTGKKESKDDYPLLEVLNVGSRLRRLEDEVCSQVSQEQFLEAVGDSYRTYYQNRLKKMRLETAGGLMGKVIGRNLDIFSLGVQGFTFQEIGETHGLGRQGAWKIFKEVKEVALGSPKVIAHLSEVTGLSVNEIVEKVAKNNH